MREILFRGKRTDCDAWVDGDLIQAFRGNQFSSCSIMPNTPAAYCWKVIPETIGQYTGLTDKNGVKIFEGDIVKTHYANAQKSDFIEQVVFHDGKFCAYFSNQLCKQWANLYDGTEHLPQDKSVYMDSVEVIGNIHDSPELLETAAKPAAKNIAQSGLAPATETLNLWGGAEEMTEDETQKQIDNAPIEDVVEVVRCKDCEYNNECSVQDFGEMHQNDFCSHGKRKELDNG